MEKLNIPPVYLLLSIAAMLFLHFFVPNVELIPLPYNFLGLLIIAGAVYVILRQAAYFKKYDTPIRPFQHSTHLIRDGLYRYTRNPIYLSMVFVLLGSAVTLGSLTPYIIIPVFFLLIQKNFVEKEEEFLSQTFGKPYIDYKRSVRRWL